MKLVDLSAGVDPKTGQAVVIGNLKGGSLETRCKWDMGFCAFRAQGVVLFGIHTGNPRRPMRSLTVEYGLKFINAVLEHGGKYLAITTIDWQPEEFGSGWVTAFSVNPIYDEVVQLPEHDKKVLEDIKSFFEEEMRT